MGRPKGSRNKAFPTLRARYMQFVSPEPNTGCWLWTGAANGRGYGNMEIEGRSRPAHRVVYEDFRGAVPAGMELDHLCRQPSCVNPDHLEPVTHRENMRRSPILGRSSPNRFKSACKRGHQMSGDNLHVLYSGERRCKACAVIHKERQRAKPNLPGTAVA